MKLVEGWGRASAFNTSCLGCPRLCPGKAVFLRAQASLGSRGHVLQPESTQHRLGKDLGHGRSRAGRGMSK